jgi:hypothetical protein
MNIGKTLTQQKRVNLVNFPVISRISLTNKSEMCRSSGHKEEVTRPSVIAAPSNSASQVSVLFKVKDTEKETLAVDRAILAASADADFKRLGSSPGTMQRLTDIVLRGIKNARGFMDDVIVFSKDYDSHLKHLKEVFEAFSQA